MDLAHRNIKAMEERERQHETIHRTGRHGGVIDELDEGVSWRMAEEIVSVNRFD